MWTSKEAHGQPKEIPTPWTRPLTFSNTFSDFNLDTGASPTNPRSCFEHAPLDSNTSPSNVARPEQTSTSNTLMANSVINMTQNVGRQGARYEALPPRCGQGLGTVSHSSTYHVSLPHGSTRSWRKMSSMPVLQTLCGTLTIGAKDEDCSSTVPFSGPSPPRSA